MNFKWTDSDGKRHRFRAHEVDGTAPLGSNAATGPTCRHRVGNKYETEGGGFAHPQPHNPNSPNYNPDLAAVEIRKIISCQEAVEPLNARYRRAGRPAGNS